MGDDMIKIQGKISKSINLAYSGGVDSVAVNNFLSRKHDVRLLHVNHGTEQANEFEEFTRHEADLNCQTFVIHTIKNRKPAGESWEEFWRNERYKFFHSFRSEVITCHHLDDCVETWVWSAMHGDPKVIPYRNRNVIRPFRMTRKDKLISWAKRYQLKWVEDSSNNDTKYTRNHIRNKMMPDILKINPGIHKVVHKKIMKEQVL